MYECICTSWLLAVLLSSRVRYALLTFLIISKISAFIGGWSFDYMPWCWLQTLFPTSCWLFCGLACWIVRYAVLGLIVFGTKFWKISDEISQYKELPLWQEQTNRISAIQSEISYWSARELRNPLDMMRKDFVLSSILIVYSMEIILNYITPSFLKTFISCLPKRDQYY